MFTTYSRQIRRMRVKRVGLAARRMGRFARVGVGLFMVTIAVSSLRIDHRNQQLTSSNATSNQSPARAQILIKTPQQLASEGSNALSQNTSDGSATSDQTDAAMASGSTSISAPVSAPTTVLTRNNQVPVGTVIIANASRNEHTVYGGDLVLNVNNVMVSRSNPTNTVITVSVPDGKAATTPALLPAERGAVNIDLDTGQSKADASSFIMRISATSEATNGLYTLHLHTSRQGQNGDTYSYDYFLPVTVTD